MRVIQCHASRVFIPLPIDAAIAIQTLEVILRPHPTDPPGVVVYETEITTEIRDDNPIIRFPFDRQEMTIEFLMPGSNHKEHPDHGRVLLPVDVQIRAEHDLLYGFCFWSGGCFSLKDVVGSHACWFEASMRGDVISVAAEFMVDVAGLKPACAVTSSV
jgi:hypothetical protein